MGVAPGFRGDGGDHDPDDDCNHGRLWWRCVRVCVRLRLCCCLCESWPLVCVGWDSCPRALVSWRCCVEGWRGEGHAGGSPLALGRRLGRLVCAHTAVGRPASHPCCYHPRPPSVEPPPPSGSLTTISIPITLPTLNPLAPRICPAWVDLYGQPPDDGAGVSLYGARRLFFLWPHVCLRLSEPVVPLLCVLCRSSTLRSPCPFSCMGQ